MAVVPGVPLSAEDKTLLEAANELKPAKSLERINARVAFIFANLSLVGTVLAGIGIFTDVGSRIRARGSTLEWVLALLFASIIAALLANYPVMRSSVNPSDLVAVKRYFDREILWRGWLARAALALFSAAIIVAFVAVFMTMMAGPVAAGSSLQWTRGDAQETLGVAVKYQGAPAGSRAETVVLGIRKGGERVLFHDVTTADPSGVVDIRVPVPHAARYKSFCASTSLESSDEVLVWKTFGLTPRERLDRQEATVEAAHICASEVPRLSD